jgi:predicted phosphoribosyltransferase
MFYDREEAGKKLAGKLKKYKDNKDTTILAIPRGGVLVAKEVARILNLPLDLIIVRKLPMPGNPEAGIGAISEAGEIIWQPQVNFYKKEVVDKILRKQEKETERRIKVLRKGKKLPNLRGRTVILVDDGIAMGSTMEVAIKTVKKKGAKKVVIAVPVGGRDVVERIEKMVDRIICLDIPKFFYAVAQAYKNWYDVSDEEVINTLSLN